MLLQDVMLSSSENTEPVLYGFGILALPSLLTLLPLPPDTPSTRYPSPFLLNLPPQPAKIKDTGKRGFSRFIDL